MPLLRAFAEMEVREQTGISQIIGEVSGMRARLRASWLERSATPPTRKVSMA
jgi:hypothetical protein